MKLSDEYFSKYEMIDSLEHAIIDGGGNYKAFDLDMSFQEMLDIFAKNGIRFYNNKKYYLKEIENGTRI